MFWQCCTAMDGRGVHRHNKTVDTFVFIPTRRLKGISFHLCILCQIQNFKRCFSHKICKETNLWRQFPHVSEPKSSATSSFDLCVSSFFVVYLVDLVLVVSKLVMSSLLPHPHPPRELWRQYFHLICRFPFQVGRTDYQAGKPSLQSDSAKTRRLSCPHSTATAISPTITFFCLWSTIVILLLTNLQDMTLTVTLPSAWMMFAVLGKGSGCPRNRSLKSCHASFHDTP